MFYLRHYDYGTVFPIITKIGGNAWHYSIKVDGVECVRDTTYPTSVAANREMHSEVAELRRVYRRENA